MIPFVLLVILTFGGVALGYPASTIVVPFLPDRQVTQGPLRPVTPRQTAQPTYNTPPPSGKCSVSCRKQFEYLADPCNCECFYQCTFVGKAPTHYKCPAGLRWNTRSMACDHMENVQCTADGGQYITGGGVYTGVMGANNGAGRLGDWNPKLCCDGDEATQQVIQGSGSWGSGQVSVGTGTRQVPASNYGTRQVPSSNYGAGTRQVPSSNYGAGTRQVPSSNYGAGTRQVPSSNYGAGTRQVPSSNYGAGTRQVPSSNYGAGTRQVPADNNQQRVVMTGYERQQKEWWNQWKESNTGTQNVISGTGTKQVPSGSGSWSGSFNAGGSSIKGGTGTRQVVSGIKSGGTKQVIVSSGGGSGATKQVVGNTKTKVVNVIKTSGGVSSGGTRQIVTGGSATQQGGNVIGGSGIKQVIGGSVVGIDAGKPGIKGVCPPGQIGRFPHATDCAKFLMCANEEGHEFVCPNGLLYDPPSKDCTWPEKANCRPTNINIVGPVTMPPLVELDKGVVVERCVGSLFPCDCPPGMMGIQPFCMVDPNAAMPTPVVPDRCRGEGCKCPSGMIGVEPFCMPDPNLSHGGEVISTNGQTIKGGISYSG